MYRITLTALLAAVSLFLNAQTISGSVVDSEKKRWLMLLLFVKRSRFFPY